MIPEQPVTIPVTPAVALEGALSLPEAAPAGIVVCHPHPLYGGDMDNPVVGAAVEACMAQGLATLRFNFRGVGGSKGAWDEGRGEQDDVRAALTLLRQRLPSTARLALAGYSFGASMSSRVAAGGPPLAGLALVAPPLAAPGWQPTSKLQVDGPIVLIAGRADQYCPPEALTAFARTLPDATLTILDGTDHFFFTTLGPLTSALSDWAGRLKG
jgi:alpha/beta superfamily hydrolase